MATEDEIESGYKLVADGYQKVVERVGDVLLPTLIEIAAGKAKDPKAAAEEALSEWETASGQRLNRAAVMRTKRRAEQLKAGVDLHAQRAAGIVP